MQNKKKTSVPWTEVELLLVREFYPEHGANTVLEILSEYGFERSEGAITQAAIKCGIRYKGKPKGRFPKGHIPQNKGQKMPEDLYKKAANTMFKKGERRGRANNNYREIGSECFRRDGYWYVKIGEKKYEPKHRIIYKNHIGDIPPGMIVVFKNGNPHDFDLSNLELISKKENLIRNRWGDGPKEYSLETKRAAKILLKQKGISARQLRENPALVDVAQAQIITKIQIRKQHANASK